MGGRRGQLTDSKERMEIIELVEEANKNGARLFKACEIIGLSSRTFNRWKNKDNKEDGRCSAVHNPGNKLSEIERQRVIKTCNEPKFLSMPPSKIVPLLADEGVYIASESTFYRILRQEKQLAHRLKSRPSRKVATPMALVATGPNQIYSWDITYLPTSIRGVFFYLYLVMDVFSRKIVGWQVYDQEQSSLAADLIKDICLKEEINKDELTLHSDNGSPMKGATMLSTLQDLGVMPSFSRPSVSNDNPYSESLFKTLKYCPEYPEEAFEDLSSARLWVETFVQWYNSEHMHSGIKYVTPDQRHNKQDRELLEKRVLVYQAAQNRNPERWSRGTRNWDMIEKVYLNPGKSETPDKENKDIDQAS